MKLLELVRDSNSGLRYCLLFVSWLGILAIGFEWTRTYLVRIFMYPISRTAAFALNLLGIEAHLRGMDLTVGICELAVAQVVYQITFECTGIFALIICLSSVLAFPVPIDRKLRGVALVVPAFICYSTTRLIVMGIVAYLIPSQIELFHIYIMVLVNIGFALLLWFYWLNNITFRRARKGLC